jgi:hypothetical protein
MVAGLRLAFSRMDLKEFVAQTLIQIVEGVSDAAPRLEALGAFVNPADMSQSLRGSTYAPSVTIPGQGQYARVVQRVEFDVAVVVKENAQAKGGVGVGILSVVSLGGSKETTTSQESNSRIKFGVPITLPLHYGTPGAEKARKERLSKPLQEPS